MVFVFGGGERRKAQHLLHLLLLKGILILFLTLFGGTWLLLAIFLDRGSLLFLLFFFVMVSGAGSAFRIR